MYSSFGRAPYNVYLYVDYADLRPFDDAKLRRHESPTGVGECPHPSFSFLAEVAIPFTPFLVGASCIPAHCNLRVLRVVLAPLRDVCFMSLFEFLRFWSQGSPANVLVVHKVHRHATVRARCDSLATPSRCKTRRTRHAREDRRRICEFRRYTCLPRNIPYIPSLSMSSGRERLQPGLQTDPCRCQMRAHGVDRDARQERRESGGRCLSGRT